MHTCTDTTLPLDHKPTNKSKRSWGANRQCYSDQLLQHVRVTSARPSSCQEKCPATSTRLILPVGLPSVITYLSHIWTKQFSKDQPCVRITWPLFSPLVPHLHCCLHTRFTHRHTALCDNSNVCHIKDLPVTIKGSLSPFRNLIHSLRLFAASLERMMEVTEPRGERREA